MSSNTKLTLSEEKSALPNSIIDYLASVPGREISKEDRVRNTELCRDADYIPKVRDAGKVVEETRGKYQVMHNGLKVTVDGYYGPWVTNSIATLQGHHEPQEEKVFYEVSKRFDSGTWMIELGSYWAYYSLWFQKVVENGWNICCEPEPKNINIGKVNFELNKFNNVHFVEAAAGDVNGEEITFELEDGVSRLDVSIRTVDSLVEEYKINRLEVLHMDVQGVELRALKGADKTIRAGKMRFVFISTHHYLISRDPNIHQRCIDFITSRGGHIICEHDIHESFSGDGLIVASFDTRDEGFTVEVSRHRMRDNQFRTYTKDLDIAFEAYDYMLNRVSIKNEAIKHLERENNKLKKDVEHLNNLPIKQSGKELAKSVKRSAKFRVAKAVWGEKHRYTASDAMKHCLRGDIKTLEDARQALEVINTDDAANIEKLLRQPSRARVAAYESLRRASHIPRKVKRTLEKK